MYATGFCVVVANCTQCTLVLEQPAYAVSTQFIYMDNTNIIIILTHANYFFVPKFNFCASGIRSAAAMQTAVVFVLKAFVYYQYIVK